MAGAHRTGPAPGVKVREAMAGAKKATVVNGIVLVINGRDYITSKRRQGLYLVYTIPKTNSSPLKMSHPKRKLVFQPSIFSCYVSFREGSDILPIG